MDVHWHPKPASILRDRAKQIVLQRFVLPICRHRQRRAAVGYISRIHARRFRLSGRFEIERAQIRGLELDRQCTLLLPALKRGDCDTRYVIIERCRHCLHAGIIHVTPQQRLLALIKNPAIRRIRHAGIVERKQERVGKRYPAKARRR